MEQVERDIQYTLATHKVEGLAPSEEALRLCRECAEGKLKTNDAVTRIAEKYGVQSRRSNG